MFGRFKIKRLPSISAPSPSRERAITETEEEQSKHDFSVAISTADAAVQVDVEVVHGTPKSTNQSEEETQEFSAINTPYNAPPSTPQCEMEIIELAATKIQVAFRGYLVSFFVILNIFNKISRSLILGSELPDTLIDLANCELCIGTCFLKHNTLMFRSSKSFTYPNISLFFFFIILKL